MPVARYVRNAKVTLASFPGLSQALSSHTTNVIMSIKLVPRFTLVELGLELRNILWGRGWCKHTKSWTGSPPRRYPIVHAHHSGFYPPYPFLLASAAARGAGGQGGRGRLKRLVSEVLTNVYIGVLSGFTALLEAWEALYAAPGGGDGLQRHLVRLEHISTYCQFCVDG